MGNTLKEPINVQTTDGRLVGIHYPDGSVKILISSYFRNFETNTLLQVYRDIRSYLIRNGYVSGERFVKDYVFHNECEAYCTCFGRQDDGKKHFVTDSQVPLREYLAIAENSYPLNRVLFCNIAWMKRYDGSIIDDKQHSGAKYIKDTGNGFEKFNFADFGDEYQYGFVETKYKNGVVEAQGPTYKKFNLSQFGDEFKNANCVNGILVIFCSPNPNNNKFCIVGYYKNAFVFRERQYAPDVFDGERFQYNLRCLKKDAVLIPADKRVPIAQELQLFHRQLFFYPTHNEENSQIYEKIVENLMVFDRNHDFSKLQIEHIAWAIPCNASWYDIDGVMLENKACWYIQKRNDISVGDIVYIYISSPQSKYKYKCLVEKVNVPFSEIDKNEDRKFVHSNIFRDMHGKYMRIKLLEEGSVELKNIIDNLENIKVAPQDQMKLKNEYLDFIENNFTTTMDIEPSLADEDDAVEEEYYDGEITDVPAEEKIKNGVIIIPRNERTKKIALAKSNSICGNKFCTHELFVTRQGKVYLEVHHLIPISARKDFPGVNIDIPENTVCLCPSCHREIHNGKNAKDLIVSLYEERKAILESKGIVLQGGIDQLLSYYNIK